MSLTKLQKALLALACVAALTAVGIVLLRAPEPAYKGKPLPYWTRQYWHDTTPAGQAEAIEAIAALCTNRIPELVATLAYDPNSRARLTSAVRRLLPRSAWRRLRTGIGYDRNGLRAADALTALQALGSNAAPAIPDLTKLTESPNLAIASQGLLALSRLGTNGLPTLLRAATNAAYPCRFQALGHLSSMSYLGTNASSTIPVLVLCCQDTNAGVVIAAVRALGALVICPDLSVPALAAVLTNSAAEARAQAAIALGHFGPDARPAVPALLQLFRQDAANPIPPQAIEALSEIAPELLTNAPSARRPKLRAPP